VTRDLSACLGVVSPPGEIVSVRQRTESAIKRNDFEIVLGEFEFADDFWPQETDDVRANGVLEPRINFLGDCGAAHEMATLKTEDFFSGFR
jgi:hypothetical protein